MLLPSGSRIEVIWSFPTILEAKLAALLLEKVVDVAIVHRLRGARGWQVLVGTVGVIIESIRLLPLLSHPVLRGPLAVAARVAFSQVVGRLSVDNPFGQVTAETHAVRDAIRFRARQPHV